MLFRSDFETFTWNEMSTLCGPAIARLTRELVLLQTDPPPGIVAFLDDEHDLSLWSAQIIGPEPFENGIFTVRIKIPPRYPFEPPTCQFVGKLIPYHPNIDPAGRICLDKLKSQPAGSWSPAVSLPSLLLSLRSLLSDPNPDDGLVADISNQYKLNPNEWKAEARRRVCAANKECNRESADSNGRKRSFTETASSKKNSTVTCEETIQRLKGNSIV